MKRRDMSSSVQLGPFELGELIGEGGMGAVYRGEHRGTGVGVAIKVIRQGFGEAARERFRREVQAHAGLVHPNVVYLFEYGTVDAAAARASGGELVEGSPFVAMELAERGTVRDRLPIRNWATVRALILQILDGLAFSHAREVIHRDLKPENFLVFEVADRDEDVRQIKLADFGIAHALEVSGERETESLQALSGTPYYMAPEQARGRWREFGPWTDLYSVGCVLWELVCGKPPFRADRAMAIITDHLSAERPPLEPQFPVPEGLERWVHRAMAIDPSDRFRRAADAAQALPGSEAVDHLEETDEMAAEVFAETVTLDPTVTLGETAADGGAPTVEEARSETLQGLGGDMSEPPPESAAAAVGEETTDRMVPVDWEPGRRGALPEPLVGTGIGVFGLREVPFVDRNDECERIWSALRDVERENAPRVVCVIGESGAGKSRLIEWVATRAHELGAASVLRTIHTRGGDGPAEGMTGLVRRACNAWKLERGELHEYLREKLPELGDEDRFRQVDARALTELLEPTDDADDTVDGPRYRFSSSSQIFELVNRFVGRYGRERPPIVWLDDAQWGERTLGWVEHLLEEAVEPPPSLVMMSLRREALADDGDLGERLAGIRQDERCMTLELEPLPLGDHRRLISRMLPLESDLADRLAERTEGNPLFAHQLIGEWVERGVIVDGQEGFRLVDDSGFGVPDDIHDLWMARLERLIDDLVVERPEVVWETLEMAAALGREIDAGEWETMRRMVGLGVGETAALEAELIDRGLAETTTDGWTFAHGLLVESLERRARNHGRWRDHNRRCVALLERRYGEGSLRTAARRAEHWIEAGDLEGALEPLRIEHERLQRRGEYEERLRVLERREEVLDVLEVSDTDPRRIRNETEALRCRVHIAHQSESWLEELEDLRERAAATGRDDLISLAAHTTSVYLQKRGQFEGAREWAERAVEAGRRAGDDRAIMIGLGSLGWTVCLDGDSETSRRHLEEARARAASLGDRFYELRMVGKAAWTYINEGDLERAAEQFRDVGRAAREAGFRSLEGNCMNNLGEIARFQGDAERARSYYRRVGALFEELNHFENRTMAIVNLAHVELLDRNFEAAAELYDETEARLEEFSLGDRMERLLDVGRMALAAGTARWAVFDRHFESFEAAWNATNFVDPDYPWLLEIAGDYAAGHEERRRAERAWRLALRLAEAYGNQEAIDRLSDRLDD